MQRVLILGAGGQGQIIVDALLRSQEAGGQAIPAGYLDDNAALHGQFQLGVPVLGGFARLKEIEHDAVVLAVGDNATRRALFERLRQQGERFITVRHPSAIIAPDVLIGPGSVLYANVVINTGSVIGENAILTTSCTIGHHNRIGSHTHIGPGVNLSGGVQVGEGTLIGAGAVAIPLCSVGSWSMVGAGAVIIRDLPDRVVAVGSPCNVIKRLPAGEPAPDA